jgi:large repetitive protein
VPRRTGFLPDAAAALTEVSEVVARALASESEIPILPDMKLSIGRLGSMAGLVMLAACETTPPALSIGSPDNSAPPSAPVVDAAPSGVINAKEAKFTFHADGATHFTCKLDKAGPVECTSPFSVTVGDGAHTLTIRAFDKTVVANPVTVTWTVDATPPTTVIVAPPATDNDTATELRFASAVDGDAVGFECALDGAAFAACTSPAAISVAAGDHKFEVRGTDKLGNVESPAAKVTWTVDPTIVNTAIDSGLPSGTQTQATDATFAFSSATAGATFECQVDGAAFAACTSPKALAGLAEGNHTFAVRAKTDAATDPSPATRRWKVDVTAPPVKFTATPAAKSDVVTPKFEFSSTDGEATFACQLDAGAFAACTSPFTTPTLAIGQHTFVVRATDPAGNHTDKSYDWEVIAAS